MGLHVYSHQWKAMRLVKSLFRCEYRFFVVVVSPYKYTQRDRIEVYATAVRKIKQMHF